MAQIDTSIYSQNLAPDIMGAVDRGLSMRDMMDKRKLRQQEMAENQAIKDAFKNATVVGPDGSVSTDRNKFFSELARGNVSPQKAMEIEQQFAQNRKAQRDLDFQDKEYLGRLVQGVKTPDQFASALTEAKRRGYDTSYFENMTFNDFMAIKPAYLSQLRSIKENDELGLREREVRAKELAARGGGGQGKGDGKGGGGSFGKAPQGYRFTPDGSLEPIPGGPAAQAKIAMDEKRKADAGLVVQDIGRSLELIKNSPSAAGTADFGLLSYIPGTPTQSLDHLLESVKSNIGFDKLQAMRQASPTGGALGSVSDKETAMLQSTAGKLSSYMPEDQLKDNLKRLYNQYNDIIHGPGNGPERYQLSFDEQGKPRKQEIVKDRSIPKMKIQDSQAIEWARRNPNDPRARQILELNGVSEVAGNGL